MFCRSMCVPFKLDNIPYCICACASVLFHLPHDQKKSLYCKYFIDNRRHYLLVCTEMDMARVKLILIGECFVACKN